MLQVDLTNGTSCTLPIEARKQVLQFATWQMVCCIYEQSTSHIVTSIHCQSQLTTLSVSPDGVMLLAIDEDGKAVLVNRRRRVLLHHVSFASRVTAAAFSPDGAFLACAVGRILQVALVVGWMLGTHVAYNCA